jgi:hypothetical protein
MNILGHQVITLQDSMLNTLISQESALEVAGRSILYGGVISDSIWEEWYNRKRQNGKV